MLALAISSIRSTFGRFAATIVAITTGIAFFVSGSMLTDAVAKSFGGEIDAQYAGVDAAVVTALDEDSPRGGPGEGSGSYGTSLPAGTLELARRTDGVAAAEGDFASVATIVRNGKRFDRGGLRGESFTLRNWPTTAALNPLEIDDGRAPHTEGEVALDVGLAEDLGVAPGDRIQLGTAVGTVGATVVGLTTFGTTDALDQTGTISAPAPWVFRLAGLDQPTYSRVLVAVEPTVSANAVVRRLESRLPDTLEVLDGSAFRTREKSGADALMSVLGPAITGFSVVSLVVCAFVILNTFNVVIAQRRRELALLRAVAATPGQVTGALVLEGSLVGALGGLAGIVAGSGLAFGLVALLGSLDLGLPPAHVTMSPWTALIALVVATGVTTVAVLIPAIRGARVPPVAALRDAAVEPVGLPRVRTIIGFVLTGLGAVGVVVGDPWPILVFGSLALFLGVFLAGPAMALGWSRVAHAVLRHLGVAPRLAADNLGRHPRRTSATSNALVVGLLLVTLVSVAGNSLKSWAVEQVNQLTSADFIVATMPGVELPTDVLDRMSATPGVTGLVALETVTVSDGGRPTTISAATSAKDLDALDLKTSKGSLDDLRGGIAVPDQGPDTPKFGSTVAYALTDGRSVDLEVTAIIEPSLDAYVLGALAEPATLARLSATPPKRTTALVTVTKGATERVGNAFKKIVASTNVFVIEGNFLGQMVGSVFDFFINVVNGLLGISVLVALIGIVNTLSLAIHERRHELGLLRAVGMSARHVRRSVRVESVLMSVLGTLVGVATGIFLGWGLTRAIDLGFAMPWRRMGIILGLGIAIGGVASILPTVRATRGEIVDAIAS